MIIYFLILLLFILDIYSISFVSSIIGNLFSLILIFIFSLTGIFIIKNLNVFIFSSINNNFIKGKFFSLKKFNLLELFSPFYILISAILFIIPGFLSDILGIIILIIYFINFIQQENYNNYSNYNDNNSIIEGKFKEYKNRR